MGTGIAFWDRFASLATYALLGREGQKWGSIQRADGEGRSRAPDDGRLQVVLTQVDHGQPGRAFSFHVLILEDGKYQGAPLAPPPPAAAAPSPAPRVHRRQSCVPCTSESAGRLVPGLASDIVGPHICHSL